MTFQGIVRWRDADIAWYAADRPSDAQWVCRTVAGLTIRSLRENSHSEAFASGGFDHDLTDVRTHPTAPCAGPVGHIMGLRERRRGGGKVRASGPAGLPSSRRYVLHEGLGRAARSLSRLRPAAGIPPTAHACPGTDV